MVFFKGEGQKPLMDYITIANHLLSSVIASLFKVPTYMGVRLIFDRAVGHFYINISNKISAMSTE